MKKLFYRIGEACKQLDIQPYVLRYWETEFPVLSPKKSKAGQRVYSEEELRLILRIKQLLYEEGYTIAGAKKKLEAELAADALPDLEIGAEPAEEPATAAAAAAPAAATAPARASRQPAAAAAATTAPAMAQADAEATAAATSPLFAEGLGAATGGSSDASLPAPAAAPANLDSASAEQVERLRSGLRDALTQAREILRLLGD